MKKYLVFTYYVGRPLGGMHDFLDSFDTLEDALDNVLTERNRYYQVVDRDTTKVLKAGLAIYKYFSPRMFRKESASGGNP